jgi:hypothetical protein
MEDAKIPSLLARLPRTVAFGVGAPKANTKQMSRYGRSREVRSRTLAFAAARQPYQPTSPGGCGAPSPAERGDS